MKEDKNRKLKAVCCLCGTFLLALSVAEAVFLLAIVHPLLDGELKGVGMWLLIAWLYLTMRVWYRWSNRKTSWWQTLEGQKGQERQKGGGE